MRPALTSDQTITLRHPLDWSDLTYVGCYVGILPGHRMPELESAHLEHTGLVGVPPPTGAPGQMVSTIMIVLLLCVVLSHSCDLPLTIDDFCHIFGCLLVICKEREEAAGSGL